MATLEICPVSPLFGVEVRGISLNDELSAEVKSELRDAWRRHALVVFRNQSVSNDQLERLASVFGTVWQNPDYSDYVSNVDKDGLVATGELRFHMDYSFSSHPLRGLGLYAIECPPEGAGGETLFSSAQLAYKLLPSDLQKRIAGRQVIHSTAAVGATITQPPHTPIHPLVLPHPETGETLLFCSRRHFLWIVGLDRRESDALCNELEAYFYRPEVIYEHRWRPGDFVVWDNLKLQHARRAFDTTNRRHLRRVMIVDRNPEAA